MPKANALTQADKDFVRIIHAASVLGDGRERHIRAFKHLVGIIEKLSPETFRFQKYRK